MKPSIPLALLVVSALAPVAAAQVGQFAPVRPLARWSARAPASSPPASGAWLASAYLHDDGISENAIGILCGTPVSCSPVDTDMVWLQYFDTNNPLFANDLSDVITRIDVAFGSPPGPTAPPPGTAYDVYVYDDPNDDSDPTDLTGDHLVSTASNVSVFADADVFESTLILPAVVEGGFFVACRMSALMDTSPQSGIGEFPASMDQTVSSGGRAWAAASVPAGSWNPGDPNAAGLFVPMSEMDASGLPGVWLMRAEGTGVPFYNRGLKSLTFVPSQTTPGHVDVYVDAVFETAQSSTPALRDMSFDFVLRRVSPNPMTLWTSASHVPLQAVAFDQPCSTGPCDGGFCSGFLVAGGALILGAGCFESSAGTVGCIASTCTCQAIYRGPIPQSSLAQPLQVGDIIEAELIPTDVNGNAPVLPETATCDDILSVTYNGIAPGTPTFWNRSADAVSFAPTESAGLIDVTAHWTAEFNNVAGGTHTLDALVDFKVNGVIVDSIPVTASMTMTTGSCVGTSPPCDFSACGDWTIDNSPESGVCDASTSGSGICVCACTVSTTATSLLVNPGDSVTAVVRDAAGSLPGPQGGVSVSAPLPRILTFCTAKTGLACTPDPAISSTGTPSATGSSGFVVSAGPARSCRSGILLYNKFTGVKEPFNGGTLCVESMGLRRAGSTNSMGTAGANCDGMFSVDMNEFAQGLWVVPDCVGMPSGIPPNNPAAFLQTIGTDVFAQFWGRDTMATGTFLSDALGWTIGP